MTWNVLTDDGKIKSKFIDIDQEMIDGLISEINELGDMERRRTNIRGHMTAYRTDSPYFTKLRQIVRDNLDFKLVKIFNIWGHVLTGMDHILPHEHGGMHNPEECGSFVYYLDVPEGSGELYFPHYDLELKPENKLFIFFDVDVLHEVLPNHDPNILRISTAGNLQILKK
jgi:hypothetical protein